MNWYMNGWIMFIIFMNYYSRKWWRCILHDLHLKIIISERRWCLRGRGSLIFKNCVALFLIHSIWEQETNIGAHHGARTRTQMTTVGNSSSIYLRHATEEGNGTRGCPCTAGHQPRGDLFERSLKPEKEGHHPNTARGGARPRDQRPRDHSPTSAEKEGENALASYTSEEDWWSYQRNAPYHARQARMKAALERASTRNPKLWWCMVWWFPPWKLFFWWCFSSSSRTAGYPMTTILQTTTTSHVWWAFWSKVVPYELQGDHIIIWWQHDCHGSQERGSDMVFFPSLGNDHVMAEAEGHAGNQFPGFPDKASNCPSSVTVHAWPWGILASVCPKVSASQSLGANGAKWDCHWSHDQGASTRTNNTVFC
jgi:hypothetical protein